MTGNEYDKFDSALLVLLSTDVNCYVKMTKKMIDLQ